MVLRMLVVLVSCLMAGCGIDERDSDDANVSLPDLYDANIGTVEFPVSCNAEAAEMVQRGLVLMHHMMYEAARPAFGMAENLDPGCVMALWGQAMTEIHPLWADRPTREVLQRGQSLVQRARTMAIETDRERAYLETVAAYFVPQTGDSEKSRLDRFEKAWRQVAERHADDLEAQAFYALAHIATADLNDKSYLKQSFAGKIVKAILERAPEHPGAHHYLIHAYDNPVLADGARAVADRYGAMTPAVPHATHMMTHIYTRLGQWQQSIEWNMKAADAAWELCTQRGEVTPHYQHALDYLAYAHLQLGEDREALKLVEDAAALQPPFSPLNRVAAAYAFAALPARYHLERHDWASAAELQPRTPSGFPWEDTHLPYIAITHFANGLGHARLGRADAAKQQIDLLHDLRAAVAAQSAYWARQIDIQTLVVEAWLEYATVGVDAGLATMREAVELEAATEKDPVTPGEVLPAIELLGDMLLESGAAEAALIAYEQSLARAPLRLNSLYGAGLAAQRSGRFDAAKTYFGLVVDNLGTDSDRLEMAAAAAAFVAGG